MKSGQLMRQVVNKMRSISTTCPNASISATSTNRSSTTCNRQATRAYYTPRAVTAFMADRSTPCSTPPAAPAASSFAPHARYVKRPDTSRLQAACAPLRRAASPMLCVTNAARHRGCGLRAPRQHPGPPLCWLGAKGPCRYRAHQSALRRQGGGWHRVELPAAFPHAGTGPVPCSHHPPVEAGIGREPKRRAVGGRQDTAEGTSRWRNATSTPSSRVYPIPCSGPTLPSAPICCSFEKGEPTEDSGFYERLGARGSEGLLHDQRRSLDICKAADWWGPMDRGGREETEHAWKAAEEVIAASTSRTAGARQRPRRSGRTAEGTD